MEKKLERLSKYAHEHLEPGYRMIRYDGFDQVPRIYRITRNEGKDEVYGIVEPDTPTDKWWNLNRH